MRHWIRLILIAIAIFGVWLIYWPIMEAFYAGTLAPLQAKADSFIFGVVIVMVCGYLGYRAFK